MKKQLLLLLLITLPTASVAQTINVHMKNGETVKYNSSDVDFLDFSETGQQSSSDKYGISGGVRVNYGKKIYSIFNYLHGDEHIATYDAFDRLYKIEIIGKYNIEWEFDYSNKTINFIWGTYETPIFAFEVNAEGCISKLYRPVVDSLNNLIGSYGYEYKYTDGYLTKIIIIDDGVHDDLYNYYRPEYGPENFVYNGENLYKMTYYNNKKENYVVRITTDNSINIGNFYTPFALYYQQITFMSSDRSFDADGGDYCIDTILFNSGMFGKVSKNMVVKMIPVDLKNSVARGTYRYEYSYDLNGYVNSMNCTYINSSGGSYPKMDLDIIYK